MVTYLQCTGRLVGVEDCDKEYKTSTLRDYAYAYHDTFDALPSIGKGGGTANTAYVEELIRLQPDVILSGYTQEALEELKTEKAMLLRSLDCADDVGISAVKKEIAALESALQKLSEQEEKYSAELDEALKQYAELKEQAAGMDAVELMDARLAVREEQERSVASRVKSAYGEKYDPMMMQDSKRDVANLLNEETEARSIRERLRQKQQAQQKQNKKKSRDRWER